MFDAKKVLDALTAANQAPAAAGGQGGLGDILGSVLGQLQGGAPGSLPGTAGAGGLPDILGSVLGQLQGSGGVGAGQAGGLGGLGGILGAVLGQATQGLQGAAQQTGAGPALDDILGRLTGGQGLDGLSQRARDTVSQNPGASAAVAGTLGSLFLGTKAGRGLAVNAAKLGGLALIGGLAYQAWQNYQAGKPAASLPRGAEVAPPPAASPFGSVGSEDQDNSAALVLLQAMIAAASADGVVDAAERAAIVGNLQAIGLDASAAAFLSQQFAHPATPQQLAEAATSPEMGAQIYTAARLTIDPDQAKERAFLQSLATELGLDPPLVAQIDAAAESAKVSA